MFLVEGDVKKFHVTPSKPTLPSPSVRSGRGGRTDTRTYRRAPKTVVKGNVVYERTATGEIIASIVKNGNEELAGVVPIVMKSLQNRKSSGESKVMNAGIDDPPPPLSSFNNFVQDCPIDETNVDAVLDRSIEVTHSMRQLLSSLKDDLRRMGGGANMTPALKPVHVRRRVEVAEKLARAFIEYRTSIDAISETGGQCPEAMTFDFTTPRWAVTSTLPTYAGLVVGSPSAEVFGDARHGVISFGSDRSNHGLTSCGGSYSNDDDDTHHDLTGFDESVLPDQFIATSANISDDLWMSCEPGSEEESDGGRNRSGHVKNSRSARKGQLCRSTATFSRSQRV